MLFFNNKKVWLGKIEFSITLRKNNYHAHTLTTIGSLISWFTAKAMSCSYVTPSFLTVWRTPQATVVTIAPVVPTSYGKLDFTEDQLSVLAFKKTTSNFQLFSK